MTWDMELGVGDLDMKRDRSETDDSLLASSSTNEFVGKSC